MKTILTVLLFSGLHFTALSQADPRLRERVDSIMEATRTLNYDGILDFTYPKLFTIVPRERMKEALKMVFENEEFMVTLDSLALDTIYPIFTMDDASYAKVDHSQIMVMKFKEQFDTTDKETINSMLTALHAQFGEGNVRFDAPANALRIRMHSDMIAVKDSAYKEWYFVNLKEDDRITPRLFDKEVLKKIKEYK